MFGVKESLIVDLGCVSKEQANEYNVEPGCKLLTYDFVLLSTDQVNKERQRAATEAMAALGNNVKFVNGLPVPEVD